MGLLQMVSWVVALDSQGLLLQHILLVLVLRGMVLVLVLVLQGMEY